MVVCLSNSSTLGSKKNGYSVDTVRHPLHPKRGETMNWWIDKGKIHRFWGTMRRIVCDSALALEMGRELQGYEIMKNYRAQSRI